MEEPKNLRTKTMQISKSKIAFISLAVFLVGLVGLVVYLKFGQGTSAAVWQLSQGGKWLAPLIVISALIDSINPCAFSVLLLTIAFLFSIGKLRSGILKIGFMYIFGLFVVYLFIGLGIIQTLHLFNTPHFMAKLGATLLIALGVISLINEFFPRFPLKLKIPAGAHSRMAQYMEKASIPTAFALGGFVGLCEFPCTGGPYLLALGLLHDQATYLKGLLYLVLYNLIFVLPLVIILLLGSNSVLLEKVQTWKRENNRQMRLWGAGAVIVLGIFIFLL